MRIATKFHATVLLAFAVGLTSGGILHAQRPKAPRAFLIAEIDVKDAALYQTYAAKVPATLAPYHAEYLVRGGRPKSLEGAPPPARVVVLQFDDLASAQSWYDSPAYSAIKTIRHRAADTRSFIVEGVSTAP